MAPDTTFSVRGFTLQSVPDEELGYPLVEWMAKHGLDRLEVRVTGRALVFNLPEYPELCVDEPAAYTESLVKLVEHGRRHGVSIVPAFGHAEGITRLVKQHPEWKAPGVIPHPTGADLNEWTICFRQAAVGQLYRAIVRELATTVKPDEIQYWMTENNLRCECDECARHGDDAYDLTSAYFTTQARVYYDSVVEARDIHPDLQVSIWTTQGSRPHNEAVIRSLPKEVLWFYYDGERRGSYNLRRINSVPPEIKALAAEGYRIGVQADFQSCGGVLTAPGRIREFCVDAAAAGLEGVCGWVSPYDMDFGPGSRGADPTLAYGAAMCCQPADDGGESLAPIMADAAREAGHTDQVAEAAGRAWRSMDEAARIIKLNDLYAYWWHGTNVPGAICERIIRSAPVDELDQRWADETWDDTLPETDGAIEQLEAAATELEGIDDPSGYLPGLAVQFRVGIIWGRLCRALLWAGVVYHRMGGWDTCHGPWRDDRDELLGAVTQALGLLRQFRTAVSGKDAEVRPSWTAKSRLPVLEDQLERAIAAVQDGAAPSTLPRQDAYPYATS